MERQVATKGTTKVTMSGPSITARVKILTFKDAKLQEGTLHVWLGNYQKDVKIIDKRQEIIDGEQMKRIMPFMSDPDLKIRKDARAEFCRLLGSNNARIHFDREKQTLTLFSANGYPPKGVLFVGLVKIPFKVLKEEKTIVVMWRGFPLGNGRAAVVVLTKGPVHITGAKPITVNP